MSSGKFRYMVVSHWLRKDGGGKLGEGVCQDKLFVGRAAGSE